MDKPTFIAPDWETVEKAQGENLPHWQCEQAIYHVSFRLADSVPERRRHQWLAQRRNIFHNIAGQDREPTEDELHRLQNLYSERIEAYLDAGHGECLLACPETSSVVADALEFFNGTRYRLHVYCIMPNHVHVLVEASPGYDMRVVVNGWTSFTASAVNRHLARKGRLWQSEPYDHIVRSEKEYRFQLEYVWNNPGKMARRFLRKRFDQ